MESNKTFEIFRIADDTFNRLVSEGHPTRREGELNIVTVPHRTFTEIKRNAKRLAAQQKAAKARVR